MCTSDQI